jgi:hypothetical protein
VLQLSSHCPADRRQLRETDDADLHDAVDVHFWRRAATVGAVSVGAAAAAAALLLSVMLRHSRALVDWAFTLQAALMFASAAALLSVSAGAAFAYVLLGVLWLWLYYLWCVARCSVLIQPHRQLCGHGRFAAPTAEVKRR